MNHFRPTKEQRTQHRQNKNARRSRDQALKRKGGGGKEEEEEEGKTLEGKEERREEEGREEERSWPTSLTRFGLAWPSKGPA